MGVELILNFVALGAGILLGELLCYFINKAKGSMGMTITEEGIEAIANYRESMVNLWAGLLNSWLVAAEGDSKVDVFTPDAETIVLNYRYQDYHVLSHFNWRKNRLYVTVNSYNSVSHDYNTYSKTFNLNKDVLESHKTYNFIVSTFDEHLGLNNISFEDVMSITTGLRNLKKDLTDEKEKKNFLFEKMLDLMLLMKEKKNRQNKSLMKAYGGLVHYLWSAYETDFSEFLINRGVEIESNE